MRGTFGQNHVTQIIRDTLGGITCKTQMIRDLLARTTRKTQVIRGPLTRIIYKSQMFRYPHGQNYASDPNPYGLTERIGEP